MDWTFGSKLLAGLAAIAALGGAGAASAKDMLGVACKCPPPAHCSGEACQPLLADPGNATDPKTGRKFWLDYPCDLKPGDKVVFILNIHGAGSIGQWQRHYFPAMDYKDKEVQAGGGDADRGDLAGPRPRPARRAGLGPGRRR